MEKNWKQRGFASRKNGVLDENAPCCAEPNIVPNEGDLVCNNCGSVIGRNIVGYEQRVFSMEELNSKKTTEKKWRDVGPRTFIGRKHVDSRGNSLSAKQKTEFNRLDKIQKSLIDSLERNKWEAKPKLELLCSKLNIPSFIKETGWRIYIEAAKKKLTMGRSIMGFIAASLYAAIRIHELPKILDEVCDSELVNRRHVHQALGLLMEEVLPEMGLKYKPITSQQLVYRFGNDLQLPMAVQRQAVIMLEKALKNGLPTVGKDPRGLAASAIYIATKNSLDDSDRRTQADIAAISKITEVTLRSRAKEIRNRIKK